MKLHIGVNEVPEPLSNLSSFELAKILESKYGLFSGYAELNKEKIAEYIADDVAKSLETYLIRGEFGDRPLEEAGNQIAKEFQDFIDMRKFDGILPNTPTKASLQGVSRRLKQKTGKPRPSFQDTGVMEASIRAWFE